MKIQQFNFSVNLLRALLWQYNEAARLESLVTLKQAWFDSENTGFWDDWCTDVFDLRTANVFGLSVWAIILNVPLTITNGGADGNYDVFGFNIADSENFENGNFLPWVRLPLTVEQSRLILRLRYFQLVTRATVPEVNAFLKYLFGAEGNVYMIDNLDMTISYVFDFVPSEDVQQVLAKFDLLPRPAGVSVEYIFGG